MLFVSLGKKPIPDLCISRSGRGEIGCAGCVFFIYSLSLVPNRDWNWTGLDSTGLGNSQELQVGGLFVFFVFWGIRMWSFFGFRFPV